MNGLMSQQAQSLINQSQESKNTETGVPGLFTGFNYPKPQQGRPIVSADDISRYLGWLGQGGGLQNLSEAGQSLFGPQGRQVAQYAMGLAENPQTSLLGMGQEGVLNQAMDFVNPMAKMGGLLGMVGGKNVSLQSLLNKWKDENVILELYPGGKSTPNLLNLSRIEVPKAERGKGIGTKAIQDVIDYADNAQKTVTLTPSTSYGATSVNRLKKMYKKLGFVENKGRNKDFTISESMYKLPSDKPPQ